MTRISIEDRFWSKVDTRAGCWVWTSTINRDGYGHFFIPLATARILGFTFTHKTPQVRAHVLAYRLTNGPIPPGLEVAHSCDNRACVRPAHLTVKTHQANMDDVATRGRWPDRRGDLHPRAKLSNAQRAEVRTRRLAGERVSDLATEFNISPYHVRRLTIRNV